MRTRGHAEDNVADIRSQTWMRGTNEVIESHRGPGAILGLEFGHCSRFCLQPVKIR